MSKSLTSEERGNWVVIVECVVRKRIDVRNCTREQAALEPWDYAHNEEELDQMDYTVMKVVPNGG